MRTKYPLLRLALVPLSMVALTATAQTDAARAEKQPAQVTFPDGSRLLRPVAQAKLPARKTQGAPVRVGPDTTIEPDWQTTFDTQADVNLFTVYDANQDGYTWGWNDAYDGSMRSEYSSRNGNDDWLISPPVHLLPGRQYIVKFNIRNAADSWVNTFEVKYGEGTADPANLTQTLQETFTPSGEDFETRTYALTVDKETYYRFGFHDNTPEPDHYWLFLDDLSFEKGPLSTAPAAVEDIAVEPGAEGALTAIVSFTAPVKTVEGKTLERIDGFRVKRDGEEVALLQGAQPGSRVSWTDEAVGQNGWHVYQITAVLDGEDGSKEQKSAYVGLDSPQDPVGVKLTDGGGKIVAQWPAARRYGQNQGYVDPAEVSLSLFEMVKTTYGMSIGDLVETSEPGATEMELDIDPEESVNPDGVTQSLYQLGARADNPAGSSGYYGTHPIVVGPTIALPFKESLSHGRLENGFVWTEGNDMHNSRMNPAGWMLVNDDPADGDAGSLRWRQYTIEGQWSDVLHDIQPGDMVSMNMPKVRLQGAENPKLFFSLYAKRGEQARLQVVVETPDAEEYELHTYDLSTTLNDGWTRKELSLDQFKGESHVVVKFRGYCDADPESTYIGLDDINIFDQRAHNLATVALDAPKSVTAGKTLAARATVKNFGSAQAQGYSVVLLCDGEPVDTVASTRQLGVLESDTVSLAFRAGVNLGKSAKLTARVVYAEDQIASDDECAPVAVQLRRPGYEAPTDLEAAAPGMDGTVKLLWERPAEPRPEVVTDDFEDYAAFATDLGDWVMRDGDQGLAGGFFQSYKYPGQGEQMAFMAFNPNAITDAFAVVVSNPGLAPRSGEQFAGAPYANAANGDLLAADNWLISPELSGSAQTIKFYAFNVTVIDEWGNVTPYNETFDLLYSMGGTDPADFTVIRTDKADGTSAISEAANWKEIVFEVPQGAKRFAVHHRSDSYNSFLFGIDDATFERGAIGADDEITAYNVYRDGRRVGQTTAAATSYTDTGVGTGDHVYNVSAVYTSPTGEQNESGLSDDASLYVNGIAEIAHEPAAAPRPRYNLQGQRVGEGYRGVVVEQGRKVVVK